MHIELVFGKLSLFMRGVLWKLAKWDTLVLCVIIPFKQMAKLNLKAFEGWIIRNNSKFREEYSQRIDDIK